MTCSIEASQNQRYYHHNIEDIKLPHCCVFRSSVSEKVLPPLAISCFITIPGNLRVGSITIVPSVMCWHVKVHYDPKIEFTSDTLCHLTIAIMHSQSQTLNISNACYVYSVEFVSKMPYLDHNFCAICACVISWSISILSLSTLQFVS